MIRAAPVALTFTVMVLAWVLYMEAGARPADSSVPVASRPAEVRRAAEPVSRPEQTAALVSAILDRPLFSPTRRPRAAAPAKSGKAEQAESPPRLAGVLVSAGGRGAIFVPAGAKPVLAREGDTVGPYTVQAISAGEVTVVGPHGVSVLHPTFADVPAGATQAAAPAPAAMSLLDRLRTQPPPPPLPLPTTEMLREIFKRQRTEPPR